MDSTFFLFLVFIRLCVSGITFCNYWIHCLSLLETNAITNHSLFMHALIPQIIIIIYIIIILLVSTTEYCYCYCPHKLLSWVQCCQANSSCGIKGASWKCHFSLLCIVGISVHLSSFHCIKPFKCCKSLYVIYPTLFNVEWLKNIKINSERTWLEDQFRYSKFKSIHEKVKKTKLFNSTARISVHLCIIFLYFMKIMWENITF